MIAAAAVVGMVGMSFAAASLYRAFCQESPVSTERRSVPTSRADRVIERKITIRLDATVSDGPWRFKPEQVDQTLHIGETGLAYYRAENLKRKTDYRPRQLQRPAGQGRIYFKKIECFCFTEQTLQPDESVDMPVTYFVDPALAEDWRSTTFRRSRSPHVFRWDDETDAAGAARGAQ
ncbi:MAG: cytochrome c oxidase assembly protein [Parvularculaceae bacterium]